MSVGSFLNRKILVTGGARGIGKTICHSFAQEGAKVAFCDNNQSLGLQTEKEFIKQGFDVTFFPFDLRQSNQCSAS